MSDSEPVPGSCIDVPKEEDGLEDDTMDNGETATDAVDESQPILGKDGKPLSKNQLKRLRSKERYLEVRKLKRAEERNKKKQKRQLLREAGEYELLKRNRKGTKMADSACKLRVAVDMSFDDLMSEKDLQSTVRQLNWCYSVNRRTAQPLQYYVTSFDGLSRQEYDSLEANKNQDIHLCSLPLEQQFSKEEIVYLSAESENVLTTLDDSKVYVIGGLVDHNTHKGLCHEMAKQKGYAHARLPIDEFVEMKTRRVLTINHVFEILVRFSENGDWEKSFFTVMPQRKGMQKKEGADNEVEEQGRDAEEEEGKEDENETEEGDDGKDEVKGESQC